MWLISSLMKVKSQSESKFDHTQLFRLSFLMYLVSVALSERIGLCPIIHVAGNPLPPQICAIELHYIGASIEALSYIIYHSIS